MRRVITQEEKGAVAVITAILLVALIGMVALAVDVGALYLERRQLQNGADAGALAIAQDCVVVKIPGCDPLTALSRARTYADANSVDGNSTVAADGVTLDLVAQKVTVEASTNDPTSADTSRLAHWFAPILGVDSTAVEAKGVAIWGPVAGGTLDTLPITFSLCEYNRFTASPDSKYPATAPWSSATPPLGNGKPIIIFVHGAGEPCNAGPSGQDLAGGFGWLDTDDPTTVCQADIVDGWMGGSTGNTPPQECKKAEFTSDLLGKIVSLPVFDATRGTGAGAEYQFHSYAAFYVAAFQFSGMGDSLTDPATGKTFQCVLPDGGKCTGSDNHILGWFTEAAAPAGAGVDPDAHDTGVHTSQLVLE